MTTHWIVTTTTTLLTGFGLVLLAGAAAQQAEGKKTEEKKKIEVRVKVSGADGEPVPARTMVRISGQEEACGTLRQQDAEARTDQSGLAVFSAIPVCKVTVKVAPDGYIPAHEEHNLADYKASEGISLKPKKEK